MGPSSRGSGPPPPRGSPGGSRLCGGSRTRRVGAWLAGDDPGHLPGSQAQQVTGKQVWTGAQVSGRSSRQGGAGAENRPTKEDPRGLGGRGSDAWPLAAASTEVDEVSGLLPSTGLGPLSPDTSRQAHITVRPSRAGPRGHFGIIGRQVRGRPGASPATGEAAFLGGWWVPGGSCASFNGDVGGARDPRGPLCCPPSASLPSPFPPRICTLGQPRGLGCGPRCQVLGKGKKFLEDKGKPL